MSSSPAFTDLLSGLLTIATSDGVEQRVLDNSWGPMMMAACFLGSSGQLGLVRAAVKIIIGISRVSKAGIAVKDLKHVTKTSLDSIAYGVEIEYGLNPRNDQPLLTEFMNDRNCPFWVYLGARVSMKQERYNRKLRHFSIFCSIVAALLTGTTMIPICIDSRERYSWGLTMLNPFGLCILAFAFIRIRGNIQKGKKKPEYQVYEDHPTFAEPILAFIGYPSSSSDSTSTDYSSINSFSSIGFIDEGALEKFPADNIFIRVLLLLGSVFVLIGYIASYIFIQKVESKYFYIWTGMQFCFLFLRYTIRFTRPYSKMKYRFKEMGYRARKVIDNLGYLKDSVAQKFILCIAAATLKEVGHDFDVAEKAMYDFDDCSASNARLILSNLNIKKMFYYQDLGDFTVNADDAIVPNTVEADPSIIIEMRPLDRATDSFKTIDTKILILRSTICYAISRAMGCPPPPRFEPWMVRHHLLCAIIGEGRADLVLWTSIDEIAAQPDQSLRKYVLIGQTREGDLKLCSQMLFRVQEEGGELKCIGKYNDLTEGEKSKLTTDIFFEAGAYMDTVKHWRDELERRQASDVFLRDDSLLSCKSRRLIIQDETQVDFMVDVRAERYDRYLRRAKSYN